MAQDNGRKRHIVVDTLGLLLQVLVTAAAVTDREAARRMLPALRARHRRLRRLWADGSYTGDLGDQLQAQPARQVLHPQLRCGAVGLHQRDDPPVVRREHLHRCPRTPVRHHRPGLRRFHDHRHRLDAPGLLHRLGRRPRVQSLGQFLNRDHPALQDHFGLAQRGQDPVSLRAQPLHPHPGSRLALLQQPHHRRHHDLQRTRRHHTSSLPHGTGLHA
ncbi:MULTISPECIES: transposase [Streptomycetaceae]|uniref:transposase n=1 Tax=Embleya scabrispora TaxID=159449 RepID=UPI001786841A|nr:transposase [Embleya scabrispora]